MGGIGFPGVRNTCQYSGVIVVCNIYVLTKGMYIKLSKPCFLNFFGLTFGNTSTGLPPKSCERNTRPMENSLILSSMVIGKISRPIFESLV